MFFFQYNKCHFVCSNKNSGTENGFLGPPYIPTPDARRANQNTHFLKKQQAPNKRGIVLQATNSFDWADLKPVKERKGKTLNGGGHLMKDQGKECQFNQEHSTHHPHFVCSPFAKVIRSIRESQMSTNEWQWDLRAPKSSHKSILILTTDAPQATPSCLSKQLRGGSGRFCTADKLQIFICSSLFAPFKCLLQWHVSAKDINEIKN